MDKYDNFLEFVTREGLADKWPRTIHKGTGRATTTLSREEKVLEQYDGVPAIYAYRQVKKQITQMRWFKKPTEKDVKKKGDFFDSVGSDNRVRTFLGSYGTQTSRNAPKASRFILAMSAWLRCLIEPPPGWVIISIDYASQEFGIAAVKSGDLNMIEAYMSGDPYLFFAKKAGAVPEGADPKWCKNPSMAPENQRDEYDKYKWQRALFKATTLGLQYGMGAAKLAVKLSADMGMTITEAQAQKLLNLHKRVFSKYWQWLDEVAKAYQKTGVLRLADGWCLLKDNDNLLSVKNFPTQGGGGAIMREAVILAHQRGIDVMSPLHDAVYGMAPAET